MKTLYKFLRTDLKSDNGEDRDWVIGKWRKEENITICEKGFHASENPAHALSYVQGEIIALVEVRGESIIEDNKQCWSEMRIKNAWNWRKKDSVAFAIFAAEQVIDIYEKTYPKDSRPRKAIEAAKTYLANPTEKNNAAADAAYAAARAAVDAAARAAAYAAAYTADTAAYAAYAAVDAAVDAADAAAYAARATAYAAVDAAVNTANAATYAARAAAYAAVDAADAKLWIKLGEWMEEKIKTLEPYTE